MVRNSGKNGGGRKGLGEEDVRLWKAVVRDVKPLHGAVEEEENGELPDSVPVKTERKRATNLVKQPLPVNKASAKEAPQLDGRTEQRLRSGKMKIDGRLDLHGYNQVQARNLLQEFVMAAHARGKRCLLVITGKGGPKGLASYDAKDPQDGILKQRLPQWAAEPPLGAFILKTLPAAQKDGGSGAFYLYLRRQRSP